LLFFSFISPVVVWGWIKLHPIIYYFSLPCITYYFIFRQEIVTDLL